ncbi:MAG: ProQ/FINO family protein [Arsenophonus sp.]|nr:MAG: ProQ/FINO family protein [Arsenophonus sp.]
MNNFYEKIVIINTIKLTNNKDIISFLATLFPNFFTIKGAVRPLKIGILQDIVELLTKKILEKLSLVTLYVFILLAYATYLLLKNIQNEWI